MGELGLCEPVPGGAATVLVRPEQVEVLAEPDGTVVATVARRDFFGHDALLALRLDSGAQVTARVFDADAGAILPGRRVGLRVRGPVRAYPVAAPTGVGAGNGRPR